MGDLKDTPVRYRRAYRHSNGVAALFAPVLS